MEKKNKTKTFDAISDFDKAPNSMLVDIDVACIITSRSRASIYRDFKAGRLTMVKVGYLTRIKVGDLRRLMGAH